MTQGRESYDPTSRHTSDYINMVYNCMDGMEDLLEYHQRHGTPSLLVLTQHSQEIARETVGLFSNEIKDKTVIEIGAGVGYLAIEMAKVAKSVIAIEVDPSWSWIFTRTLYAQKPRNLTWIFGDAEQLAHLLDADICVIFTKSGEDELRDLGNRIARKTIMPFENIDS